MADQIITPFPQTGGQTETGTVYFNRQELNLILNIYGRMVAAGEARDYAIDMNSHRACFAIYRRASEMPIFRIEKSPKLARKQGAYTIYGLGSHILRRGHELEIAIRVLERKLLKTIET